MGLWGFLCVACHSVLAAPFLAASLIAPLRFAMLSVWGFIKTAGKIPFVQGTGVSTLEGSAEQQKERSSKKSGAAKRAEQQKERSSKKKGPSQKRSLGGGVGDMIIK